MGGTSFDVGLIMGGEPIILREVELGHMIFNIPTLVMDSTGTGTGMYIRVDPARKRLEIGPDSAGAEPGPVCYNLGNETPTVMDCCLVLGIINPDYYLGGQIKIYPELAYQAIKEKCADLLGLDVYTFAEGVMELIHTRMREHIRSVLYVRGFSPADYHLISYGGAGPMFMAGYTEGLPFKGVFTIPFAAAFSSYGCAAVDYVHRYQKSTTVYLPPNSDHDGVIKQGEIITTIWEELEGLALKEMTEEGFSKSQVNLDQIAYIRYGGQLEDLEIPSPVGRIKTIDDMQKLLKAFDEIYSQVYAGAAQHTEAGYQMLELGVRATVSKQKPMIKKYPLEGKEPPKEAFKGERKVWVKNRWLNARLYEMDLLRAGNEIEGPAIIEAPSTTVLVPETRKIQFDQYKVIWMI
jgi:N-methylhydantoinase A